MTLNPTDSFSFSFWNQLASALREHETLSAAEVRLAIDGKPIVKPVPAPRPPKPEIPALKGKKDGKVAGLKDRKDEGGEAVSGKKGLEIII